LGEGFQRALDRQVTGATLSDYQDAGHRPSWEDPARCADAIVAFADQTGVI
jgi:pimeloyl-ACP methyl ester carboxylesterase